MDKASIVLESLTTSSLPLLVGYQRLSSNPHHVDNEIGLHSSLVHSSLPDPGCVKVVPDQTLVEMSVDLVSPLVVPPIPEEHHDLSAHVLLVSLDSPESKNDPSILTDQEDPSSFPIEHGSDHMIPPPSSVVVSFNWSQLTTLHLPS